LVGEIINSFSKGANGLGMSMGDDPIWIEVPNSREMQDLNKKKSGSHFEYCVDSDLRNVDPKTVEIVIVLVQRAEEKAVIKRCLDKLGFASQFLLQKNIQKKVGTMGVISNILRQMNAKTQRDLYRVDNIQKIKGKNTMVVGLDVVNKGVNSIVGLTASNSKTMSQYFSKICYQTMYK